MKEGMFLTFPRIPKCIRYDVPRPSNVYISGIKFCLKVEILEEYLIGKVYAINQSMDQNKLIGSERGYAGPVAYPQLQVQFCVKHVHRQMTPIIFAQSNVLPI